MLPLREGFGLESKRPLLIPAVSMYLTCLLSYLLSDSLLPVKTIVFLIVLFLTLTAVHVLISGRKNLIKYILIYFSIASVCLYMSLDIGFALNNKEDVSDILTVNKIERRLDGSMRIEASDESGVRVMVITGETSDVREGDVVRVTGDIKPPKEGSNPGSFSYRDYLKRKGIKLVSFSEDIEVISRSNGFIYYFQNAVFTLRTKILGRFTENKGLTAAVCLGDSSLLDDGVIYQFKMCNCSHLLAVSGMHFAGFLFILPYVFKSLKISKNKALAIYILLSVFIGLMTGFKESVTRAAVMSCCSFAERDRVSAMSLASVVMLAADPFSAVSTGFLMSFSSCMAIICLGDRLSSFLEKINIPKLLRDVIAPGICATFGLMPFWDYSCYRISPALFLIQLIGGFICQVLCIFFVPAVLTGITAPLDLMFNLLMWLIRKGCAISVFTSVPSGLLSGLILSAFGLTVILLLPSCFAKRYLAKPASLVIAVCLGFSVFKALFRPGVTVVFADVGQGDCCLIITPDKTCLIDGGVYEEGDTTVRDILDFYGIAEVDIAFMSHWDTDHAAGLVALARQNRIKALYTGFTGVDKDVSDFLNATDLGTDFPECVNKVRAGDVFELSTEVKLSILYPDQASGGGNKQSLVMRLDSGDVSVLFTGDIDSETEAVLLEEGLITDVDILKVAHHGSRYSTSESFLDAADPEYAVISVGENNFYGHPADETIARLEQRDITILRTDTMGAVIICDKGTCVLSR